MTLDAWLSAAEGDASGLWFTSVFGDLLFPECRGGPIHPESVRHNCDDGGCA
jgi:hypothetical protein